MIDAVAPRFTGITVRGTSVIGAVPDIAVVLAAISHIEQTPKEAFAKTRSAAAAVHEFITRQEVRDFGSSRITLTRQYQFNQGEQHPIGYNAKISYRISIGDLDRTEELLEGLIAAGASQLESVSFETTQLPKILANARRQAIRAARERAELYCREVGASVGRVLAVYDTSPDALKKVFLTGGSGPTKAIEPTSINVEGSVDVTFQITSGSTRKGNSHPKKRRPSPAR